MELTLDKEKIEIESLINEGNVEDARNKLSDVISMCLNELKASDENRQHSLRNYLAIFYNLKGQVHYKLVQFSEAFDDYTQCLSYNHNFAAAYYNRGTILYRLGNFSDGLKDMESSVKLEPQNTEFHKGFLECQRSLASQIQNT